MSIRGTVLFLLATVFGVACHGSSGGPPPAGAMTIGAAGATLAISAGPLAGVSLAIPPGALGRATSVKIVAARARSHPGFRSIGPAAVVTPEDVSFSLPVLVTLPYDSEVPATNDIVILAQRASGEIVELGPTTVDTEARLATVGAASFAMFWVAERLFGGVPVVRYLPLHDGDRWDFDTGLRITAFLSPDEPNLDGLPVFRLQFDTGQEHRGFYVQRDAIISVTATELLGEFGSDSGSYQQLDERAAFLPARATIGQPIEAMYALVGYTPYGAATPTYSGAAVVETRVEVAPDVTTPIGTFTDVLRISVRTTVNETSGRRRETTQVWTLAYDVGPVLVEGYGDAARLVRGFVGGESIGQ